MRLLLDTHVLVWLKREPARLSKRVASLLTSGGHEISVSPISAWEIATKVRLGKLNFDAAYLDDFDQQVKNDGFHVLNFTPTHAVAGARLSGAHKDPFDRMLAGQSLAANLDLVSSDPMFKLLGLTTLW